jgi:GNAT superfamily N-acetyltransferase
MTTATAYEVRPMTMSDEPAVLDLLHASLAGGPTGRRTSAFFRWKHHANPFGRSPAFVADCDGQLVGLRTFLRWEFRAANGTVRAVRAVDTATHPSHQGRGIFRQLTLTALRELAEQTDLVFNTPNSKSLPGYLKMGWQVVGEVPVRVRIARPLRFLRAARTARSAAPNGDSPKRCDLPRAAEVLPGLDGLENLLTDIATEAGASPRLTTPRTVDYLRWRYVDPPDLDYRAVPLMSSRGLRGVAIGRARYRGSLVEFTLAEMLVSPGDVKAARNLLGTVARSGVDHVAAHLAPGSEAAKTALSSRYFIAPGTGVTLVARPGRDLDPDPCRLDHWQLSLGDLEVF